jgi:lathosterol oxidase
MPLQTAFGRADDLLTQLLILSVVGLTFYFGFAGLSQYLFSRRSQAAPTPTKPEPGIDRDAILLSVVGTLGNAVLTSPVLVLVFQGSSQMYFRVADHGWAYLLFSILALLAFTETLIYWLHRALHLRTPYQLLHAYHHSFRTPTAWVSFAFHPLDSFIQALPYHLFIFLFPLHFGVYVAALVLVNLWTFLIHEPVPLLPDRWLNLTAHHAIHHSCNKYNYGQFFTIWDRMGNTYRSPQTAVRSTGIPGES